MLVRIGRNRRINIIQEWSPIKCWRNSWVISRDISNNSIMRKVMVVIIIINDDGHNWDDHCRYI